MTLDNPDIGTEDHDEGLETKLRAEAERMTTTAQQKGPPQADDAQTDDEPEQTNDDAQATKQTSQEPQKYRVKVDNDEQEVTLDDLLNGYSRQADYTRKMQALAEERKQLAEGPRSKYEQLNGELIERLQAFAPQKPDIAMLNPQSEKYNPDNYHLQKAYYDEVQGHLQSAKDEKQRLDGERQEEAKRANSQHLAEEEKKLLRAIPEWKDQRVMQKEATEAFNFVRSFGYSVEEARGMGADHRLMVIARLAMQAATAKDQKSLVEAKVKDAPPVIKPGAAVVQDTDSDEVKRARAAVKKNPRDDRALGALFAAQDKQQAARANRR